MPIAAFILITKTGLTLQTANLAVERDCPVLLLSQPGRKAEESSRARNCLTCANRVRLNKRDRASWRDIVNLYPGRY